MSIEEIIDVEQSNNPEFADSIHGFKGTKDEWAIYWMQDHMIPGAMELGLVANECAMRRVLALAKKAMAVSERKLQMKNIKSHVSKAHPLDPTNDEIKIEFYFEIDGIEMFLYEKFSLAELTRHIDNGTV